jgi:hypothetical protein
LQRAIEQRLQILRTYSEYGIRRPIVIADDDFTVGAIDEYAAVIRYNDSQLETEGIYAVDELLHSRRQIVQHQSTIPYANRSSPGRGVRCASPHHALVDPARSCSRREILLRMLSGT